MEAATTHPEVMAMAVSKTMIESGARVVCEWNGANPDEIISGSHKYWEAFYQPTEISIEAAIDAAWTKFDPFDESTKPNTKYAPSGMMWLIVVTKHDRPKRILSSSFNKKYPSHWNGVRAYCDPIDLLPSFIEECGKDLGDQIYKLRGDSA